MLEDESCRKIFFFNLCRISLRIYAPEFLILGSSIWKNLITKCKISKVFSNSLRKPINIFRWIWKDVCDSLILLQEIHFFSSFHFSLSSNFLESCRYCKMNWNLSWNSFEIIISQHWVTFVVKFSQFSEYGRSI